MPGQRTSHPNRTNASGTLGYEAQLWRMADALRSLRDVAEYKDVVLGLLFLKYISDALEAHTVPGCRPSAPRGLVKARIA